MIHPEDEASILAMLGGASVPEDLLNEYEIRIAMYHRAGGSGYLGPLALVAMTRSLGYEPANMPEKPQNVDWRDYPQDGSTRVEARFFGDWVPGVFLGFVEAGTLAIRLDMDEMVRECRRDMVRLAGPDAPPPPERPARVDLLEEEVPESTGEVDESDDGPEGADYVPIGWETVESGTKVWVQGSPEEDILDGEFLSVSGENVTVKVKGEKEPRDFPVDAVTIFRE